MDNPELPLAFPNASSTPYHGGMTLRDYFAAKALNAIYSNPLLESTTSDEIIAKACYTIADAMLKARKTT